MNKDEELEKIAREIELCKICRVGKSGMAVPGEGNSDADIVFLGEAPGRTEAATGRPFIGRSGKLLRKTIQEIGIKDEDVYITSPVKYLPDRGTPTKKDIAHGRTHLSRQLDVIHPKIIVLMGSSAMYAMLERVIPVKKERGSIIQKDGRAYFLTFHPAAILRFPSLKNEFIEDFRKLKTFITS